jgi:hypothetical protein
MGEAAMTIAGVATSSESAVTYPSVASVTDCTVIGARSSHASYVETLPIETCSGATLGGESTAARKNYLLPFLRAAVIATVLPFSHIDTAIFGRRQSIATVSQWIVLPGEGDEDDQESPSLVCIQPIRDALILSPAFIIPLLPPRHPFVPKAGV